MTSATPAAGLSRYELWYGRAQKPVARERLAAGDLTVELEGAEIRSVRLGDLELLRNVYVALRDEEWGTVAGILSDYEISRGDDEFAVSFEMTHRQPPVAFTWTGRIEGDRSGALSYELDGLAEAAFRYCRIGFCLLHPPGCAGHRYRGNSPSGLVEGTLPLEIGPQVFERGVYWPLFPSVDELELSMDDDVELELLFEGDLFEMEDQRNWTDASFKTYCTPQELGYPFDARAGQRFRQKVTIQVTRGPSVARGGVAAAPAGRAKTQRIDLELGQRRALAPIGFALPRGLDRHSDGELALLRTVNPAHLRVELVLAADGWPARLEGAAATAESLGCPLEIVAFAEEVTQLDQLLEQLASLPVARLLLFPYEAEMSDPAMTRHARERIVEHGARVPVIGGTDLWFAELNRARPDLGAIDGLAYTITPQVHTFDEESIAQSLEAQPETVRTATTFADGLPIVVSPVTLRPRDVVHVDHFNPAGTTQEIPFSVDPRQSSLFAAAWTVGSIAALADAGAASLTYYETVGWRGIIPGDRPLPEPFIGAPPGGVFPIFHVFANVLEAGGETILVGARSARPTEVCALALSSADQLRVLVSNLTPSAVTVELRGLPAGTASARMLDEHTGNQALSDPLTYRSRAGEETAVRGGHASIDLAPFAIACVDAQPTP